MSSETVKGRMTFHVKFVPDEDVVELITDKPAGVKLRNKTTAQRKKNVKSLTNSPKRSKKMAQLASEMARTPGKTVTICTSDGSEEAISPPASKKKKSTIKTRSKNKV